MDQQSERRAHDRGTTFSRLDWPTAQVLATARRARSQALREMAVGLARRTAALVLEFVRIPVRERLPAARRSRRTT